MTKFKKLATSVKLTEAQKLFVDKISNDQYDGNQSMALRQIIKAGIEAIQLSDRGASMGNHGAVKEKKFQGSG